MQQQIPCGDDKQEIATPRANATANTGILHCVQDDDVKQATATTR
jgi:hypothetical protein